MASYRQSLEFRNRSKKVAAIRQLGINPYPYNYLPTHSAQQLHQLKVAIGRAEAAERGATPRVSVAGRLFLCREMGKLTFCQLRDQTGTIQLMISRGEMSALNMTVRQFVSKYLDLGDWLGVEGYLFYTQKGELTILVEKLELLCKSLLPLPDKYRGLNDPRLRSQKRWLELLDNSSLRERLVKRSEVMKSVREFFRGKDFLEVETTTLQDIYGGARARPFRSYVEAFDREMFLRISLELPLKKLLVGGLSRVFEIGKVFRNEGIDRLHQPEFTELEAYAAYWDYKDMRKCIEELFAQVAVDVVGSTKVQAGDREIDFTPPWRCMSMVESLQEIAGIDVEKMSTEQIWQVIEGEGDTPERGELIVQMFEKKVQSELAEPCHIVDHPLSSTPLCKEHRDKPDVAERFESFILGWEMCNSYSEMNDPELQRELLLQQAALRSAGDEEAHPFDEDFVESLCQGMPPAAGVGIGMDRMIMLYTGARTMREVMTFPMSRCTGLGK